MTLPNFSLAKLQGNPETDTLVSAFVVCFNEGRYFEAHDVLEQPWLQARGSSTGQFYRGLIQLAAAFVHLQRHSTRHPRLGPASRLLKLARANLEPFRPVHRGLDVTKALETDISWQNALAPLLR